MIKKYTTPNQKELPNGPTKKSTEPVLAYKVEGPEGVGVLRQTGRLQAHQKRNLRLQIGKDPKTTYRSRISTNRLGESQTRSQNAGRV